MERTDFFAQNERWARACCGSGDVAPIDFSPTAVLPAKNKQKNNKRLGSDDLPCEVLKAGEDVMAIRLSELGESVKKERRWPVMWKGGRIVDVLKKGNFADCDNSQGILLACHCFKVLFGLVMAPVTAVYNQMVPSTQFGAVSKRGSDFATHVVLTAIDVAK